MTPQSFDLLIIGDEVESVLTAVSAYRAAAAIDHPVRIGLVRHNAPSGSPLGGLSTRGGLSYMDITPEYIPPLFGEFLDKAGVRRVALCPVKAHRALLELLSDTDITVIDADVTAICRAGDHWQLETTGGVIHTQMVIDSTPDTDIARLSGAAYTQGLGHFMRNDVADFPNHLGVSAVFTLHGLSRQALINIEQALREQPDSKALLQKALPYKTDAEIADLLTRPVFSPDEMDYVDILNPLIGIHFHVWQGGIAGEYLTANVHIDGFNTSRLPEHDSASEYPECFGMNGVVMTLPDTDAQMALSQNKALIPKPLADTIHAFRDFLVDHGAPDSTRVSLPHQAYVRQTVNAHTQRMVSVASLFAGGVPAEQAIGTFSYWVDLRGIQWRAFYPEAPELPKPVFHVGLNACFPIDFAQKELSNLGVVSRSAGYGPLAQGPCRIIQHQAMVGEALGIAAVLAHQASILLHETPIEPVQMMLSERYQSAQQRTLPFEGQQTLLPEDCIEHPLIRGESRFLARA